MRYAPDDDIDRTEELDEYLPAPGVARSPSTGTPVDAARVCVGTVLRDRYVLDASLAVSGRSIVFAARDLRRDADAGESSDVAVKVLCEDQRRSEPAIARLRREFRQTQALRHPGAVRMYDLDCDRGTWFITMERLEGASLRTRLERESGRALNTAEALRIAFACADVLDYAHQQGTPHGDFKPGNVFLDESGAVKVLDFGAAADIRGAAAEGESEADAIPRIATRSYASPEVLEGLAAEPRDDVFSFACVVYEMLAGRHPFDRVPAHEARDAAREAAPLPQLAPAQNAALLKGLAWTRAERPASAPALIQSMLKPDQPAAPGPPETTPPPPTTPAQVRPGPNRWLPGLAAALVAVAVLWFAFSGPRRGSGDEPVGHVATEPAAVQVEPLPVVPAEPSPDLAAGPASEPTPIQAHEAAATAEPQAPAVTRVAPAAPVVRERGRITADSPSITVSEGAPSAVILLRREGDRSAAVRVSWSLKDGSARAGGDYEGPTKGTVRFLSGQSSRALYIPLVNDGEQELQEFFTLSLASRSTALGQHRQVTITIDDDD